MVKVMSKVAAAGRRQIDDEDFENHCVELKEYHGVHTICPLCPDKVTESDC